MRNQGIQKIKAKSLLTIGMLAVLALLASMPCLAGEAPAADEVTAEFEAIKKLADARKHLEAATKLRDFTRRNARWERFDEANLLMGCELVLCGDVTVGKEVLDRIIQKAPEAAETAPAYFYRGTAYETLGDFAGAVLEYDVIMRRFPKHALAPQAALNEALIAGKILQNPKRAREVYEVFVANYPNHPSFPAVQNHLALMSEQAEDWARAVTLYRDYATKFPKDIGDQVMNGHVAGPARAMWQAGELAWHRLRDVKQAVALYQAYENFPQAAKGNGFMQCARILSQQPAFGDPEPFYKQAIQANQIDQLKHEYARWLVGAGGDEKVVAARKAEGFKQFSELITRTKDPNIVADSMNYIWQHVGQDKVKEYLEKNPTHLEAFKHYLTYFKEPPERRAEVRPVIDAWLARQDIDWKTAMTRHWLTLTGEVEDAARMARAAVSEGMMADAAAAAVRAVDGYIAAYGGTPAEKRAELLAAADGLLVSVLDAFSACPDFPRDQLAVKLAGIARVQPLMVPVPPPAEGQPAPAADAPKETVSPEGKAARTKALELIRKHKLNGDPAGADAAAQLAWELDPKAALAELQNAASLLLKAGRRDAAAPHVVNIIKELPEHDQKLIELLVQVAWAGPQGMEKQWNEVVLPKADAEVKFHDAVNPPTEQSRLVSVRLARFFDAKKSVATHDAFIKDFAGSAQEMAVRRSRIFELQRAGVDPKGDIAQAIKDIEATPAIVRAIPVEMVPGGPEGVDLYETNVRKVLGGADANLAPDLLLNLALVQERFNRVADAMKAVRELVGKFANTPQATEGKRCAARLFERNFFPPGVTQADAEQAFAWAMELCASGADRAFPNVSTTLWRLACNPAYRMHGFHSYDSLYLYSTHDPGTNPPTINDFLMNIYATPPGDGIGPAEKVENAQSPYRPGERFLLYRWGLLRAPIDGYYHFWWGADDWAGLDINGRHWNFARKDENYAGIQLSRGLHMCRIAFGDWGGGASLNMDWQPPHTNQRVRLGPDAFSAELYPVIMSYATLNQGAWGMAQWDAYVAKFPRDARGRMMRLQTLCLTDPNRAVGELQKLMTQFPANLHYRERFAECLWRLGRRDEAMKEYSALAARPALGLWESGMNPLYRDIFLGGKVPINFEEEYQDRVRAAADWNTLVASMQHRGDNGQLAARLAAENHIITASSHLGIWNESVGRINATIAKEQASIEAAKELAAKPESTDDIRRQAELAVARSTKHIADLQKELQFSQAKVQAMETHLGNYRKSVGLGPEQPVGDLPISFAAARLANAGLEPGAVFGLATRLWSNENKDPIKPFLEYILKYSGDLGQISWCIDRLVDFGVMGKDVDGAAQLLGQMGMRNPREGTHAHWLRRSCDLALQSGNVYLFARNAQVLAKTFSHDPNFTSYLDRLGEVFEKAGNFASAEHEYQRVIREAADPAQKRRAQLSQAMLYKNQGKPIEGLKVLSNMVKLTIPQTDKSGAPTPAPAMPKEGEAQDAGALLAATECYLALEQVPLALNSFERASVQKEFGTDVKPSRSLLFALTRSCLISMPVSVGKDDDAGPRTVPAAMLERADKVLKLVDVIFRFHGDQLDARGKVEATLLRADANVMMRNYPRAIEEIRAARQLAGDTPIQYLVDLKGGEVHLSSGNPDQAIPIFQKLSKTNIPEVTPVALFWLGTTQLRMGNREAAIDSFRTLWERFAENDLVRQAIYTIARTYAEQGAFLDAIRLYEAVGAVHSLPREKVAPGDILTVKVWDADHYLGTGEYTIPVEITSSSGDSEKLLLDMNKINRSLFLGTIRTELGETAKDDGVLQVYGTDVIYVTYIDRFTSLDKDQKVTAENVQGERKTSVIQVVDDGSITVSPTKFVEKEQEEDDIYVEKTERELEEEKRLQALSAKLQRGEAVVRPGNLVYLRVKDGDFDRSNERDTVSVTAYTYAPEMVGQEQAAVQHLANELQKGLGLRMSSRIPDNGDFTWSLGAALSPAGRPRLDSVQVKLTETGPHTGIFYGVVKTDINGPTAIASDASGESIAALAIDGKNGANDAWVGFIDAKPGKWLEVDMKELQDVSKIVWDRGVGADDRYMIDYTVTLRGDQGAPVVIERKDNKSAHNVEVLLDRPVRCRWIRFTAQKFEGDAPAISEVQVFDKNGKKVIPPAVSPLERSKNDILEFNVGDCMAAEFVDEENFTPGRSAKRTSNPLGVAYVNGHIDAVYLSRGRNPYLGHLFVDAKEEKDRVWARRTKRVRPDDTLQIVVVDPDLDIDDQLNTVQCEVFSSSGDYARLEAKELDPTAAVFAARMQLSPAENAKADEDRLWVRPGDFIMMRYLDEQNRKPGHPVYRESFVFVADEEVADFTRGVELIDPPAMQENSMDPPNWEFTLNDPDLALPGVDRIEMQALSLATGDYARFIVLLRNLDGDFSSRVPVAIADKPEIELSKDADAKGPRRIRALDEWWAGRTGRSARERREQEAFETPLAVSGDDIIWTSYKDTTPKASVARTFMPVASPELLEKLQKLDVNVNALSDEARTAGLLVSLVDPAAALAAAGKQRDDSVLNEAAKKKLHYRRLIGEYTATLERINKRIGALKPKDAPKTPTAAKKETKPKTVKGEDAPLIAEEANAGGAGDLGDDMYATEDLIRAAALRRDRDALNVAVRSLQQRLKLLDTKFNTTALEAAIEKAEAEERAKVKEPVKVVDKQPSTEKPPAWYSMPDWWKDCGGIVPGTVVKVRVEDPDLQGNTIQVLVSLLGREVPGFRKLTAKAIAGEKGVFEVMMQTAADEGVEGAVSLKGVRHIMFTYQDAKQETFPDRRQAYLSLASNATFNVTGPDFLETKSSFHLGEDIYMIVRDADMDKTRERDFIWIEVTSDSGDRERVPVRESQPHSGVFRGSVPTEFSKAKPNDGVLQAKFGGTFKAVYVDQLWRGPGILPPEVIFDGSFVSGSDGTVEIFARQLKRGSLQRDVLFNTALASYELGKSSTEMGAVQRGFAHLIGSRDGFRMLIEQYPDDPMCAHATYYLGNIQFLMGNYAGAVQSLQEVIDRWPKSEFKARALFKLGTCRMKAGEMDKAIESFVNLAYHHSDSPLVADSMLTLATHFASQKRYKAAIGIGEAFITKFPGHEKTSNMYLRTAGWLIVEKKFAQAAELLEEAEKSLPDSPNMPAFLYWHADCIFKTAGINSVPYKRAIILLQRVTYDYPDSKWAKYAAARLAEKDVTQ
ncbi:MAG TPA: tetratricopeptide repeat protein [Planctomycetota bacterium]|nr:tetratricopeptide repeat protein [Planctomycetota bacterium]